MPILWLITNGVWYVRAPKSLQQLIDFTVNEIKVMVRARARVGV